MNERVAALRRVSMASGLCLLALMALSVATGHSQQAFEFASSPQAYADRLLATGMSLHWTVAVDDAFIACYVTTTLLFVRELGRAAGGTNADAGGDTVPSLAPWIAALGVLAGLLDVTENHHILSMLRLAHDGVVPDPVQLTLRETLSSLKWMAGHLAFFMVGMCLPATTASLRLFRGALLFVQLPVGALALVLGASPLGEMLNWARLLNVLAGFGFLAAVVPLPLLSPPKPLEGGSGALA